MKKVDPKFRIVAYIVLMAGGGVLVALGIAEGDVMESLEPIIGGALMVSGGGLATANVNVKERTKSPGLDEWAMMGRDAVPAILDEINRLREDVNARDTRNAEPAAVEETAGHVPDAAPWLAGSDYVGQHRLD